MRNTIVFGNTQLFETLKQVLFTQLKQEETKMKEMILALANYFALPVKDEKGQGMVEYALILVLVSVVAIVILRTVGTRCSECVYIHRGSSVINLHVRRGPSGPRRKLYPHTGGYYENQWRAA